MKKLFLILVLSMGAGMLQANELQNYSSLDNYQQAIEEEKVFTCNGWADCGGYSVYCTSYGDGCSWRVASQVVWTFWGPRRVAGVVCNGYDRFGNWSSFYAWCN